MGISMHIRNVSSSFAELFDHYEHIYQNNTVDTFSLFIEYYQSNIVNRISSIEYFQLNIINRMLSIEYCQIKLDATCILSSLKITVKK